MNRATSSEKRHTHDHEKPSNAESRTYLMVAIGAGLLMAAGTIPAAGLTYFIKPVSEELGFDRAAFSLHLSLFYLMALIGCPIVGRLEKTVGARRLFMIGGTWVGLGLVALSFCTTLPAFYLASIVIGLASGATLNFLPVVVVNNWFVAKKGLVMGLVVAGTGFGGVLVSLTIPGIIADHGRQTAYLTLAVMTFVLAVVPAVLLIRNRPSEHSLPAYGETLVVEGEPAATAIPGMSTRQALRSPWFYLIVVMIVLLGIVDALNQQLPALLADKPSIGPQGVGMIMATMTIALIFVKPIVGWLVDKVGIVWALIIVNALHAVSMLVLPTEAIPLVVLSILMLAFGIGNDTVIPPLIGARAFGRREFAAIWGLAAPSYHVGLALGNPMWASIYDATGTYDTALMIAPAILPIVVIGFAIGMRRGEAAYLVPERLPEDTAEPKVTVG